MRLNRWRPAALAGSLLLIAWLGAACTVTETPEGALKQQGGQPGAERSIHLASLIILDLNTDYGFAMAIEPQTSTLPSGDVRFLVLNKWLGLRPGEYAQMVRVLAPNGKTVLYETGSQFEVDTETFSATLVEPVLLEGAVPGIYLITVDLDGREMTRYPFRVIGVEEG